MIVVATSTSYLCPMKSSMTRSISFSFIWPWPIAMRVPSGAVSEEQIAVLAVNEFRLPGIDVERVTHWLADNVAKKKNG